MALGVIFKICGRYSLGVVLKIERVLLRVTADQEQPHTPMLPAVHDVIGDFPPVTCPGDWPRRSTPLAVSIVEFGSRASSAWLPLRSGRRRRDRLRSAVDAVDGSTAGIAMCHGGILIVRVLHTGLCNPGSGPRADTRGYRHHGQSALPQGQWRETGC